MIQHDQTARQVALERLNFLTMHSVPKNDVGLDQLAEWMYQFFKDHHKTLRAALQIVPPVTEGWKLVPIEPTDEMKEQPAKARQGYSPQVAKEVYQSMLASAPQPPADVSHSSVQLSTDDLTETHLRQADRTIADVSDIELQRDIADFNGADVSEDERLRAEKSGMPLRIWAQTEQMAGNPNLFGQWEDNPNCFDPSCFCVEYVRADQITRAKSDERVLMPKMRYMPDMILKRMPADNEHPVAKLNWFDWYGSSLRALLTHAAETQE